MSLSILAQGTLVADPQQRTSSKGNAFATCSLRVATEDEPVLVSVIAFGSDAVESLLNHGKGDTVAVTGRAKLTSWAGKDGETCRGLSVVAERVLSLYEVGRRRAKASGADADQLGHCGRF